MKYVQVPTVVTAGFVRQLVSSGVEPKQLKRKDIQKCLIALKIGSPEILTLRKKDDLWMQLLLASAI